jgi:hypothetical protein
MNKDLRKIGLKVKVNIPDERRWRYKSPSSLRANGKTGEIVDYDNTYTWIRSGENEYMIYAEDLIPTRR